MSLYYSGSWLSQERLDFLVQEYSLDPKVIKQRREFLWRLWYWLGLSRPTDELYDQTQILHNAIEGARRYQAWEVEGILGNRSPRIKVSESDLDLIQSASNLYIHSNHQAFKDIPYLAQMLREIIGTDSTTHFVMKKWVPFPWYFKSAWWIIVLRWKDLKAQTIQNKKRRRKGQDPVDIEANRPELIRPKDLPQFAHQFTQEGQRNLLIFDKWTRNGDSFFYEDKVIWTMQNNIDQTLHNVHILVWIKYWFMKIPEITLKVLNDDEMRNGELWETVNWFLDWVRSSAH